MAEGYPSTPRSALALFRFISRSKPRFIFPIHHGNYDSNQSYQHRIISTTKALARSCSVHSTCRHQGQVFIYPDSILAERYHASNWQSIKNLILFTLISHLSKQTLLLSYFIYFCASFPIPFVAKRGICFSSGIRELKGAVPMYVSRFSPSEFSAQPLHGPYMLYNQITSLQFHRRMY